MSTGSNGTYCQAGGYTTLCQGPTWGFTYIHSPVVVHIKWRRYSDSPPWYMTGEAVLHVGQNTVVTGGPAIYERLQVDPDTSVVLKWS